jgi:hypothetical protein
LATRDALRDRVIHVDDFPFAIRNSGTASDAGANTNSEPTGAPKRSATTDDGLSSATLHAADSDAAVTRKVA